MKSKGMAGHESVNSRTDTWITPRELIMQLGEFDLDPCAAIDQPWHTAKHSFTELDDGLSKEWFGRVFLNSPYSKKLIRKFMEKMAKHNNGIALTFARTETQFFHKFVFPIASSILFIESRVKFCNVGGIRAKGGGGAPSVLIAYGESNSEVLSQTSIKGHHISLNYTPFIVVGISPTWISVVTIAVRHYGDADLKPVYDMVERIAPDKIALNQHWKAKIRQSIQVIRKRKTA